LKITFLGTGTSQGIPVIGCDCETCRSTNPKDKRLRTSIMVETQGKTIVIDTGPDFRQQMLRANVSKVDAVLLTHEHNDHVIGIDDVRPFNFKYEMDMPIYADQRVLSSVQKRFNYIFESKYPGIPRLVMNPISKAASFEVLGIPIIPIEVMHHKLPVLGYRFGNFTYLTDVKTISETELRKTYDSDVLVINALHKEAHISHLTLDEALELIERIEPKQAYLIHFSHRMGLHHAVLQELPSNVSIAYDGMVIDM
jgi:phosphoribosyl 1,2-cyclic phosphate phosphodiesterase